jgi:hypothetical protein
MDCLGLLQGEPHEEDGVCCQLGRLRMAVDANEDHWILFASFLCCSLGSLSLTGDTVRWFAARAALGSQDGSTVV